MKRLANGGTLTKCYIVVHLILNEQYPICLIIQDIPIYQKPLIQLSLFSVIWKIICDCIEGFQTTISKTLWNGIFFCKVIRERQAKNRARNTPFLAHHLLSKKRHFWHHYLKRKCRQIELLALSFNNIFLSYSIHTIYQILIGRNFMILYIGGGNGVE